MKRIITLLLCAAMVLSSMVFTTYAAEEAEETSEETLSQIFKDTKDDAWYSEAVYYAYTRGYVSGKGEGVFAPAENMTRAQLVTILYRMEGSPAVSAANSFDDVAAKDWYYSSVLWASESGIVTGKKDNLFAPGDNITREQLAMILYRYADSMSYDVTARSALMSKYPDNDSISSYAADAVSWAVAEKIISGKSVDGKNYLSPKGLATRAEVSVMLQRFIEDYSIDARPYKDYVIAPNVLPENMKLYGVLPDLSRLPDDVAAQTNSGVIGWEQSSTGGRLKFKTNSDAISFDLKIDSYSNGCGIDVFVDGEFVQTINPPHIASAEIHGTLMLDDGSDKEYREITVYLTRNSYIYEMVVGLDTWAEVKEPDPYINEGKPVVFYGSSITQGCDASSPSKCHVSLICEALGLDFINLGFGGSALGEPAMAEYIATLEMSAFVMEYDHNAPDIPHLEATHKPFFDIIRAAQPTLPILIISAPDIDNSFNNPALLASRRVILETYHAAIDAGDRYVDFIDGFCLYGSADRDLCFAEDLVHPSDYGFAVMADLIIPRLKALLNR